MVKVYTGKPVRTEVFVQMKQEGDCIGIDLVDQNGNHISHVLRINKDGLVRISNIDNCCAPFALDYSGRIRLL